MKQINSRPKYKVSKLIKTETFTVKQEYCTNIPERTDSVIPLPTAAVKVQQTASLSAIDFLD